MTTALTIVSLANQLKSFNWCNKLTTVQWAMTWRSIIASADWFHRLHLKD
jgi:hypothetical protein